ncbi:MAG: methionyl-tRNA formyltransferase, partial [Cytophagales bacterium]
VQAIAQGNYPSVAQSETIEIKHAPKIFKETCEINWNQSAKRIVDFVRGLSPYPAAWTTINDKQYKILKCEVKSTVHSPQPKDDNRELTMDRGLLTVDRYETDNKSYLYIKTADGWISIDEFQPEGKKRMKVEEFFRGNKM